MRCWKVKVMCEGYEGALDDPAKVKRAYVRWLVQADTSTEAMKLAVKLAEGDPSLSFAVRWKSFEAVMLATVGIPVSIDTLTEF